MKNTALFSIILLILTGFTYAQQTYVPDDNFENYLETHDLNGNAISLGDANSMGNGIANDNYVFTSRISNVTYLDVSSQNIAELTGIEDFQNLQTLRCLYDQLTNIDITQNTALQWLYCGGNQLTSLNITHNTALQTLECFGNQLTGLDITQNTALQILFCESNQLTDLDIMQNTALQKLDCGSNQLTDLDITQNVALQMFNCWNNQLTNLDMRNGNNTSLTSFDATLNPNLTCAFVDNANYMNTNWSNAIDTTASYIENQAECDALGIDETFKEQIQIYPNPFSKYLSIKVPNKTNIKSIRVQNMQGQVIYKKKGFTSQIRLSSLSTGVYFLSIKNKDGHKALFKLIKH